MSYSSTSKFLHTNESLKTAVNAWLSDETIATQTYGHISTWQTQNVTDISGISDTFLFSTLSTGDISTWDIPNIPNVKLKFTKKHSTHDPLPPR